MDVTGLTLVTLLIAEAEVEQAFQLVKSGFDSFVVKSVFLGIVDGHLPLSALDTGHTV